MDGKRIARLEPAGFRVGSVAEFLGLTSEDVALVEADLAKRAEQDHFEFSGGDAPSQTDSESEARPAVN